MEFEVKKIISRIKTKGPGTMILDTSNYGNKEYTHKFTAHGIKEGDPSFILKHVIIDNNKQTRTRVYHPFIIYNINEIDHKEYVIHFINHYITKNYGSDFYTDLIYDLYDYINKRKITINKKKPILTAEEIDYVVSLPKCSTNFIYNPSRVRVSIANVEIYNKKYYLYAVQKPDKYNNWTVGNKDTDMIIYKLIDAKKDLFNIPEILYPSSRNGISNKDLFAKKAVKEIIFKIISEIKQRKEKEFLRLRENEYTMYNSFVYGLPKLYCKYTDAHNTFTNKLRDHNERIEVIMEEYCKGEENK